MQIKTTMRDFPGGQVVKIPPSNAGETGSISGWETKIPQAVEHLSSHATTRKTLIMQPEKPAYQN